MISKYFTCTIWKQSFSWMESYRIPLHFTEEVFSKMYYLKIKSESSKVIKPVEM